MKSPWGKAVRGRAGSQLTLVDARGHPGHRSWVLMAVGVEDGTFARVQLTRKALVALRKACETAIALDTEAQSSP